MLAWMSWCCDTILLQGLADPSHPTCKSIAASVHHQHPARQSNEHTVNLEAPSDPHLSQHPARFEPLQLNIGYGPMLLLHEQVKSKVCGIC